MNIIEANVLFPVRGESLKKIYLFEFTFDEICFFADKTSNRPSALVINDRFGGLGGRWHSVRASFIKFIGNCAIVIVQLRGHLEQSGPLG